MKNRQVVISSVFALILWGGSVAGAYFIGKNQNGALDENVVSDAENLRAVQADAAVVKRVSQQMEAIAYQQKAVSDKQRDRAEEQSALALQMRDRAEQESRAARDAEKKAVDAAQEAEVQRAKAISHQKMAEEQRDQANYAKSVTDTVSRRALGRTLGNSALMQYENGNKELGSKLAYLGWYLLDKYKGNTFQPEVFKALSVCTESTSSIGMSKGGGVRAMCTLKNGKCLAVSDYGEIELMTASGKRESVLLQDKAYNFVGVQSDGNKVYALSHEGTLCIVDFDKRKDMKTLVLPTGLYNQIIQVSNDEYLLVGDKNLCWFNSQQERLLPQQMDKKLSCAVKRNHTICLFFADKSYAEMDGNHNIQSKNPLTTEKIVVAYYHQNTGCLFLGTESGAVVMVNKYNHVMTTLNGHISRVTSITESNDALITCAYDKTVLIWNLPRLSFHRGYDYWEELELKTNSVKPESGVKHLVNEWVTPANVVLRGWPFCVCNASDNYIMVGQGNGSIDRINISVIDMASMIKKNMNCNLTNEEWNRYVGSNVPRISF